jgi:cytochrome c oxidase assembly protein subunit 15
MAESKGTPEGFFRARNLFARATAGATWILLFAGGLVTSTGSALSVPDWPLSYGQFFPPMVGGVLYEHGHRMIAATVALLTAVLAIWTWREEPRSGVRWLAVVALVAVLLQAVLGGLTVLFLLPTPVSVSHACLGQVFFCLTVVLATVTGREWVAGAPPDRIASPLPPLAVATTVAIFLQLVLGAVLRHTGAGLAIPDFPLAFGKLLPELDSAPVALHFAHRMGALAVAGLAVTTALAARRSGAEPKTARLAGLLLLLLAVQIALGAEVIWSAKAPLPTTLHVATGAALLATSVVLSLRAYRLSGASIRREPIAARSFA